MMARKSVGGNQPTLDMVFFLTLNNAVSNFFGVVVFLLFFLLLTVLISFFSVQETVQKFNCNWSIKDKRNSNLYLSCNPFVIRPHHENDSSNSQTFVVTSCIKSSPPVNMEKAFIFSSCVKQPQPLHTVMGPNSHYQKAHWSTLLSQQPSILIDNGHESLCKLQWTCAHTHAHI